MIKYIKLITVISSLIMTIPTISLEQSKVEVIIDADTGNEVDDLYAVTRALLEPTWDVVALNATQWESSQWAISKTMENSHRLNQMLASYLDMNVNTKRGGVDRMFDWGDQAQHSAAAYDIIKRAKERSSENKLKIIALGALTNVSSALFIEPSISDKIDVYWLGSTYDFEKDILRKNDFNCMMDLQALDLLLFSDVEMHIIPVSVASQMEFDYSEAVEKLTGVHPVTDFLLRRWDDHLDGGRQKRTIWDLALIAAIIHPEWAEWTTITTSRDNGSREIEYISDIDEDKIRADFYDHLITHLSDK